MAFPKEILRAVPEGRCNESRSASSIFCAVAPIVADMRESIIIYRFIILSFEGYVHNLFVLSSMVILLYNLNYFGV